MADRSRLVEVLKDRINIIEIIGSVVSLKKAGKGYIGLCPFHRENTPSFHVYEQQKRFYCYGCQKQGDAFSFLQYYHNQSFVDVLKELAHRYHLESLLQPSSTHETKQSYENLKTLLEKATLFYVHALDRLPLSHPAKQMIAQRQIRKEILELYQVGWSDGQADLLKELGTNYDDLVASGLLCQSERNLYYHRFVKRIVFPIRTAYKRQTVAFGGRSVDTQADQKYPKYINTAETVLFKKSECLYGLDLALQHKNFKSFVIVEGYFDVLQMANHGFFCAVAPMGTALGADHVQLLLSHHRELIFCFDGDSAGQKASYKALSLILPFYNHKRVFSFVILPAAHDPDSFLRTEGRESFVNLFQKRVKIGEYLFKCLEQLYPSSDVDSIVQFSSAAKQLIRTVEDTDARMVLMQILEQRFKEKEKKDYFKKKTQPVALKSLSTIDWIYVLVCAYPQLENLLGEVERKTLCEIDLQNRFARLWDVQQEEKRKNFRLTVKNQYQALIDLMPLDAVETEFYEQLKKLGLITPNTTL